MCHIRLCGGINSIYGSSSRSIFVLYLLRSSPFPVPSMFHIRLHGGINSISGSSSRSIFVLYLLRSTPSPSPVPSMFHIRYFVGGQLHLHICVCVVYFEGPLHLQLQSHVCFTLDYVGEINSISGSSSRSIFVLYLLRCTPSPSPVPSMFHIRLCGGNQLHLRLQLQINISVVPLRVHSISDSSPIYISP